MPLWYVVPLSDQILSNPNLNDTRTFLQYSKAEKVKTEAETAKAVLEVTDEVFEFIALTEEILAKYPGHPTRTSISRRSRTRVKSEVASPVKITTISRDSERRSESSRQESKPIRVRDESTIDSDTPDTRRQTSSSRPQAEPTLARHQVKVEHDTPSTMRQSNSVRVQKEAPPIVKPKKRSRPSFPPREGPDYTTPLPTPSATVKKQRLQPFQSRGLRR